MDLDFTKDILYICSNDKKDKILDLISKEKNLVNIKFMTLSELKSELFFSYEVKVYPYIEQSSIVIFSPIILIHPQVTSAPL